MEEYSVKGSCLVPLTIQQMQIRGGARWIDLYQIIRLIKMAFDFIDDYKKDAERGFDKGWRIL